MNAINSVMEAINRQEGRSTTEPASFFKNVPFPCAVGNKIKRTVEEELDFTRNYLDLEKFQVQGAIFLFY